MKLYSLIQLVFSVILLLGVATLGIAHTINGSISFFGILFVSVIIMLLTGLVRSSWGEWQDEKNK
jgi:hypothetical protein